MDKEQLFLDLLEEEEEDEKIKIDWQKYVYRLWNARWLFLKIAGIAAILGVIIALTIPKIYTVKVTLAPETSRSSGSGSISSIASMLGVSGFSTGSDADALKVIFYPDIVSSTPFILDLLDTQVRMLDEHKPDTTLMGYLTEHTSSSLMGNIMSLPFKAIGSVKSLFQSDEEEEKKAETQTVNPFHLTKKQTSLVKGLKRMVGARVDKKTGITTISVTMQDPMVAAILADTVVVKLKEHITLYRTSKAKENLEYWEQLFAERKEEYHSKQKAYAEYVDANKNIILHSVRIEQERLQNEMNLAYQVYTNVAGQLQMAKAKVQEAKPVFAVVEPATVPLKSSGTSRKMILLGVVFFALAATAAWVLFGKELWKDIKQGLKEKS